MAKPRTTTAWAVASTVLSAFAMLAWLLPRMLGVSGGRAWLLGGGLVVFGLISAGLILLVLLRRARESAVDDTGDAGDDIDHAFAAAEAHLARSGGADTKIGRLPLIFVIGPVGSTKSSIITHSGLDAELISGEVYRGEAVVPTESVNIWYAQGTILVEAGGRLLDDAARWKRLVRHLRPHRLAAALGRGKQAPRMALLCIGCDEFLKPGASQALAATARHLRTRLAEMSQELGIALPVYTLFTRIDRLPFFTDYVRNFTALEAQQVLGATLPLAQQSAGGWAEYEARRLNLAFDRVARALSLRRIDVLTRETQDEQRAGAYEFPRELRKLNEPGVQFMLDVFRPSQLGVNPFLRGFYFTGVRPVVMTDIADIAPRAQSGTPEAGATSVFNLRAQQAAQAAAPPPSGSRRVPQWVFIHRLFRDVMQRDEVAHGVTGGGTRVDLLRRGLIAAAAVAGIVFALGFTTSFIGNRSIIRNASAAVESTRLIGGVPGTVSDEDLARLDTLRERTARVTGYRREGHPAHLGWGLYRGDDVQAALHPFYFDRFGDAMWYESRDRLEQYLRSLPAVPDSNSDFGRAQDALAAYLITTSEYARSTPDVLAPALLPYWAAGTTGDSTRSIAQRQFEFLSTELAFGNPYDTAFDAGLVQRTQQFLRAFGAEAYYNALLYEASGTVPAVRFEGPAAVVVNPVVVPGAFTLAGWQNVQANLDRVEELFQRNRWIYGNEPPTTRPDRNQLARQYETEYVRRWQRFIDAGSVARFGSVSDAAAKLAVLGATDSPLFGMLAIAARETAMDSTTVVGRAFQPLHATVAPGTDPRAVTVGVLGYANTLNALSSNLNLLSGGPPSDAARLQASSAASAVNREASTIAASFAMSGDAAITSNSIQRLLRQPAQFADDLVSGLPAAALNEAGAAFCATFSQIARRFPFTAGTSSDAPVDGVTTIFARDDGTLRAFYQDALQSLMTAQGAPRPGARVNAQFRSFFSRAIEFSDALFRTGGGGASLVFDFQPDIPAGASDVVLDLDGEVVTYTPTSRASRSFEWQAERSRSATLSAMIDGERVTIASGLGPWAVFRLFGSSTWSGSGPYRVQWRVPGRSGSLVAQVSFETGTPPVLRPRYLDPLSRCVSQISF